MPDPTNDNGSLPKNASDVESLFDRLAPRYDLLNHLFSLGLDFTWRWRATRALAPRVAGPLLDGATGSGDLAVALARRYPDRRVVGVDFSAGMLAQAPPKARRAGVAARVEWVRGDLTALPFPDAHFAGATVAFGVRNVMDRAKSLAEFRRVLKPGCKLLVLEFAMPTAPVFAPVYRFYFRRVMPLLADLAGMGRAYRYLFKSVNEFPLRGEFWAMLKQAGFENVSARPFTLGTVVLYEAS
jgi:demethylmenaquinone methyltransferase/2-methoxy-6-polyprenyl-1,4-benzoquinol methylase